MKKIVFLFLIISVQTWAIDNTFSQRNNYRINNINKIKGYNFIIFINQLPLKSGEQSILDLLSKKEIVEQFTAPLKQTLNELYNNNYQLFMATYKHQNELLSPHLNQIHQYKNYQLRKSKYKLNSERQILKNTFIALDEFVLKEKSYRPICIIVELPPKSLYSLEVQSKMGQPKFKTRRDFSIINLYHEIHKRRYLYPNKIIVYESEFSNNAVLINNR